MPRRWYQRPPARHVMVDREARDAMALLVRALVSRRMVFAEFEKQARAIGKLAPGDPAINEAFFHFLFLYEDVDAGELPRVPRELRREIARIILFLKSDVAYCWLPEPGTRRLPHWPAAVGDAILWLLLGLKVPVVAVLACVIRVVMYFTPDWITPRRPVREEREQAWPFPDVAALRRAETEVMLLRGVPCV